MKILLGVLIWVFLWREISYALPIWMLVFSYEWVLLGVPFIVSFLSIVIFYFRLFLTQIISGLLIVGIIFYSYIFYITGTEVIFSYEWGVFFMIFGGIFLSKKNIFLPYILLFFSILIVFVCMWVVWDIVKYKKIASEFEAKLTHDVVVEKIKIEKNFSALYIKKGAQKSYVVVWKWEELQHCTAIKTYFVCTGGNRELWSELSQRMYEIIQSQ